MRLPRGRLLYDGKDKFFAGFCALQKQRNNLSAGRVTPRQPSALQMVYCGLCGGRIASSAR